MDKINRNIYTINKKLNIGLAKADAVYEFSVLDTIITLEENELKIMMESGCESNLYYMEATESIKNKLKSWIDTNLLSINNFFSDISNEAKKIYENLKDKVKDMKENISIVVKDNNDRKDCINKYESEIIKITEEMLSILDSDNYLKRKKDLDNLIKKLLESEKSFEKEYRNVNNGSGKEINTTLGKYMEQHKEADIDKFIEKIRKENEKFSNKISSSVNGLYNQKCNNSIKMIVRIRQKIARIKCDFIISDLQLAASFYKHDTTRDDSMKQHMQQQQQMLFQQQQRIHMDMHMQAVNQHNAMMNIHHF